MPSQCPEDGRCLDVGATDVYLCLRPCSEDAACGDGFVCQPITITTGGAVCLPSR